MTYEVTLLSADIRGPLYGEMRLGLEYDGSRVAAIDYQWDAKRFTATFHGHAASMPEPAHPTVFVERPIAAINQLKTPDHTLPSDVFVDNRVFMTVETKG